MKTDEAEPVTTKRAGVYSEAYSDYRGKVVVVVIPKKGTARAYRRQMDESYRNPTLRELDGLLMGFCEKESH